MGNRSDKEVSSKVESAIFAYSANKGFRAGSNQGARLQGRSTKRDVWLRQKLPFTYQSGNGDNWVDSSRADGVRKRTVVDAFCQVRQFFEWQLARSVEH